VAEIPVESAPAREAAPSPKPLERRPVASRQWRPFQAAASWLVRRNVSPNAISLGGMVAGVAAGAVLWATARLDSPWREAAWIAAAAAMQLRLIANLLDGMVAIASGKASPVGELYNEVPDRVSDAAALIGAGYAAGGHPLLGWAAAAAAILTAYVRVMAKVAGAPMDYSGPMAKQQRMFVLTVTALGCALAPASWQPRWELGGAQLGLAALGLSVILAGSLWTSARRLRRAAAHLKGRKS
jgi:phosphatidylglycerophosphate synthase